MESMNTAADDEIALAQRIAAGDEAALAAFYERYADHAVSVTRRVVTIVTGEPYAGVSLKATS